MLASVRREVGIAEDQREVCGRQAERVGADLQHHGVGALADIDRAAEQGGRPARA